MAAQKTKYMQKGPQMPGRRPKPPSPVTASISPRPSTSPKPIASPKVPKKFVPPKRQSKQDDGSSDSDETQRQVNREKTMKRSRMWCVVGSSDEEDENSPDEDETQAERQRKSARKSRSRSDSDSSSPVANKRKKHKKDKKKKKKHRKKKDRKRKRDKKEKRTKKRKKAKKDAPAATLAVDQNQYGKYGIVRESDYFRKQIEFEAWLREVKKIANFNGPKYELKNLFKEFAEDYNTVTLPHKKFYNFQAYEKYKYAKKQRKAMKAGRVPKEKTEFRDERDRKSEIEHRKKTALLNAAYDELKGMSAGKAKAMRDQQVLRSQMQLAWKSGNMAEFERIKRLLDPDAA